MPGQVGGSRPVRREGGRRGLPRWAKLARTAVILLIILVLGWGVGLGVWTNSHIQHTAALSGAEDTPGTTYLVAGADLEDGGAQRTDTLMLVHKADNGNTYLVSIPRDTLVDIPGKGKYKINAAYAMGGPQLLVKTIEQFTGLTVDHFVVIGFDGVTDMVDAVGHVNLCIDQDVDDEKSGLKMTKGCHDVGGEQALAFVRARYFDPRADLGRQERQQQFISSMMKRAASPAVLLNPFAHVRLASASGRALLTDDDTGLVDVTRLGMAMRSASNSGSAVPMPIDNPAFQTKHSGVAISTDDQEIETFFSEIKDGTLDVEKAKKNAL
ncbi:LCP family protein [Helcobacillus massiliensis]|uniref:LCP family protein required for cell wall assembly n=1 Tax=Helcobacillus massiliensis TaxID=521392 RepID=A0A839R0R1_9MICO|nr:LCP family protein [Helcobacillus massiliensis]MBB3021966.1 LCP family protein required for cell wall assembly [Helcobacillus massiliensis]MCT1557477.1 LCP family protein [Helcobacillus massiliensis]MCT2036342.1 LCP family protein [Helcobacillus massiliensis]MCT2331916.1 LCP family protein [Helcobacillus massiliensis]